ncbi:hypothetical protein [Qipengyuania sp. ASV99]|uniref:hypothetical protein n=1 Tax=Qipengyuania sp. ASV99 TaxID=3399681 RepID=UPI003A4C554D
MMEVPAAALLAFAATPAGDAVANCEAHFFPTDQVQGFTSLGDYGLISDLLSGGPVPAEEMLAQIKADTQFEVATGLIERSGRLPGFRFIEHYEAVEFERTSARAGRLTASLEPCYVEIVVNYISFSDSAISKKKVGVHFVTRDFRERPENPVIRRLGGAALLAPHVELPAEPGSAPRIDFVGAYTEAFDAAIERFWRR